MCWILLDSQRSTPSEAPPKGDPLAASTCCKAPTSTTSSPTTPHPFSENHSTQIPTPNRPLRNCGWFCNPTESRLDSARPCQCFSLAAFPVQRSCQHRSQVETPSKITEQRKPTQHSGACQIQPIFGLVRIPNSTQTGGSSFSATQPTQKCQAQAISLQTPKTASVPPPQKNPPHI